MEIQSLTTIGIISIVLFWTYIEIGTGFLVACIPRSAWVVDKIPVAPILTKLRSLSSISLLRKDQSSHRGDKDSEKSQSSWIRTLRAKASFANHPDTHHEVKCEAGPV